MKALLVCAVILLTCAQISTPSAIENNEVPDDSNADELNNNSDVVFEAIQPLNDVEHQQSAAADESLDDLQIYSGNQQEADENASPEDEENTNENADDDDDNDDDSKEMDIDMMERTLGIEIPICEEFAELNYPLHLSHLDDCGKFYKCSNGRGYLFDCPSDEHWSVKLDRCDYPPLAGCKVDGHHQYKLKKVLPRQANGNEESIDADNESSNNDFEIDPRCEGGDPFKPLHYQHPSDCTKFYKCYMGKAYVIKCPRGQHWSQKLNRCEHPSLARCHIVKPAAASLIVPFMDIPEEKLQKIPTIIDDSDYMIEDPRCEVDEADRFHPIHFSHPSDCQMFYKCFNNLAFKSTCPNGLHYNAKTQACDYPPVAKCKLAVKIVPAQMLSVKVPSIPDCTHGRSVSFGLQGSLKRYFQCRNGEVFLMECSEDQFFNPNSMQCDYFPGEQQPSVSGSQWPIKQAYSQYNSYYPMYNYPNYYPDWQQNSDWQQYPDWQKNNKQETSDFPSWLPQPNQNAGKPSVNKPPKESARDDNSFDFGKGKTSSRCPVHEDDMHPVLLAHESDCKKFYKCFRQKAFLLSCPEGEEFSEKLKRCDYHQYANCDPAELIRRKIQM